MSNPIPALDASVSKGSWYSPSKELTVAKAKAKEHMEAIKHLLDGMRKTAKEKGLAGVQDTIDAIESLRNKAIDELTKEDESDPDKQ